MKLYTCSYLANSEWNLNNFLWSKIQFRGGNSVSNQTQNIPLYRTLKQAAFGFPMGFTIMKSTIIFVATVTLVSSVWLCTCVCANAYNS